MAHSSCSQRERVLTLDEILTILEDGEILADSNQPVDIFVQPPNNANNDLTDEDSGDEDSPAVDNLPRSQLLASAEISAFIEQLEQNHSSSSEDEELHNPSCKSTCLSSTANTDQPSTSKLEAVVGCQSTSIPTKKRSREDCDKSGKNILATAEQKTKIPRQTVYSVQDIDLKLKARKNKVGLVPKKAKKKKVDYTWKEEDLKNDRTVWPVKQDVLNQLTPMEQFFNFFDDDIIDLFVDKTNRYAAMHNRLGDVSAEEMKCFIAVLLLSGYVKLPRRRMYWESSNDTHNDFVANSISRDRFEFILSNIHVCDNDNLNQNDKYAKVRPLYDALNQKFVDLAPHEEHHSIDESMVPYFGRHSLKQFIRNKPIRYGYKIWVGTTFQGYIVWKDPYQGKSQTLKPDYAGLGLGASVVLNYCDVLQNLGDFPFFLYFDNFFCGLPLMKELSTRTVRAIGTMREDRTGDCPLEDSKAMKKKERGALSYRTELSQKTLLARWNDNSIVTIASNAVGVQPLQQVKRFSQKEKKHINICQPNLINQYNKKMGGVDRSDQNISLYRVHIRGKKWYFPLISDCIDSAEQNAWQLHRRDGGKLDHLAFRRRIVCNMLESFGKGSMSKAGRPSKHRKIDSRFDRLDHLVVPQEKQTRCGMCHNKCTTRCKKCDIGLHTKCFVLYHTKP